MKTTTKNFVSLFAICAFVLMAIASATEQQLSTNCEYGSKAQTVISPNYKYSKNQRIVIMPFQTTKERTEPDLGTTDKFALKVMQLGLYTIIDRGMVESFYQEHGIAENATLNKKQLELIKKELGVDLVFYGTMDYTYVPSHYRSGSTFATRNNQYYVPGDYYLTQATLKGVSTVSGEVLITSVVSESPCCDSRSQEMVYSIKKKVAPAY